MRFELARPNLNDAEVILSWRLDPEVMKNSCTFKTPLSLEQFYPKYLASHFSIPELPPLFLLQEGKRIGLLRFNYAPGYKSVEISIVLASGERGHGLGKKAIQGALDFAKEQGFYSMLARVKVDNIPSIKAFEGVGFNKLSEEEGFYHYEYTLCAPESTHVFVIAEVGSNWKSADPYLLIDKAKEAGADAVKFQVFRAEDTYVQNAGESGYLKGEINEIFKSLEMPYELIPKLAAKCEEMGLEFMATPFSLEDFKAIDPYVKRHKIASYENNHLPLLEAAAKSGKPLIVSTGASTGADIKWTYETLKRLKVESITLLQCLAKYPAPSNEMNLNVIPAFKNEFKCSVGLSDHTLHPYAAPLAAVSLGATVIEKHYTLDRSLEGPDHSFAIEPHELKELVAQIRLIETMLGSSYKKVEPCEKELRAFARRGIQAIKEIKKGELFEDGGNVAILRPGNNLRGAAPSEMEKIAGTQATRFYKIGEGVFPS